MHFNPTMLYVLALASGIGFGFIAWRAGRSVGIWGTGGALFGLTIATFIVGVGHAIAVPYSDEVVAKYYWTSVLLAALIIGAAAVGSLFVLNRGTPAPAPEPVKKA